eukprot:CAMPEP_0116828326 /NCGR_PEP_ID=MMETSP0418-20121206/3596_1 /TAXON_ID=1158023 /ORGANISM="Astrosyne radiata, Strain 13vi08-1A" /LENGTH=158 /DNA_ID=CAMNT_0004457207 /DNA_START=239 /DNA_END=716 /DNA_ORIENTATION=+
MSFRFISVLFGLVQVNPAPTSWTSPHHFEQFEDGFGPFLMILELEHPPQNPEVDFKKHRIVFPPSAPVLKRGDETNGRSIHTGVPDPLLISCLLDSRFISVLEPIANANGALSLLLQTQGQTALPSDFDLWNRHTTHGMQQEDAACAVIFVVRGGQCP